MKIKNNYLCQKQSLMNRNNIYLKVSIIVLIIIGFACSNTQEKVEKDDSLNDSGHEICIETARKNAQEYIEDFYNMLMESNYDIAEQFFPYEEYESLSVDEIRNTMRSRNLNHGIPEYFEFSYFKIDEGQEDLVLVFDVKLVNNDDYITYENFVIRVQDEELTILNYKYSIFPFYTLEKLNDSLSVVNMFIRTFFEDLDNENYDVIFQYVDNNLVKEHGKDKIIKSLQSHKDTVGPVISFKVVHFSVQELEGMIPIDLSLKVYYADKIADEVLILTDSPDGFIIQFYLPDEIPESFQRYRIRGFEDLNTAINSFYDFLKQENIGELMRMADKSVFEKVSTDEFKFSFESRNSYYGKPMSFVETSRSRNDIYTTIFTEVENLNSIKSYEGVTFALSNGEFYLYGYQYSNTRN